MKHIYLLILISLLSDSLFSQTDKVAHFGVGYIASSISTGITANNIDHKNEWIKCLSVGLGTSILLGTAKEVYDFIDYGKFDFVDLGATIIGGAVGTVTIKITINQTRKSKSFNYE